MCLKKVISGGQCGADVAGVGTAKLFGLETGGMMPKGFKTQFGDKPSYAKLYNMTEHSSPTYPPRTAENVKNSDGTIRLAFDFESRGEKLTKKFIEQYNKPDIEVDLHNPRPAQEVVDWILAKNIVVLNVAGNSEKTYGGTNIATAEFLAEVFSLLGFNKNV